FSILKELKHIRTGRLYSFKKGKESVKDGLQLVRVDLSHSIRVILRSQVVNERLMQHINIASLGYYFETRRSHYFDLYSGRLFDDIVAKGSYSETEAAPLVATILSAVNHLHNEGIVHGNLKAENLLFRHHPGRDIVITDSDFMITGITNDLERIHITSLTELLRHWPAEPGEPAIPSWLSTPCSAFSWISGPSARVTCFMLAGAKPFERATRKAESDVIIAGDYGFGENVSNAARDLIRACLAIDPAHRSTAAEALRHEVSRV
ncbi:kinase-like domain-containing protein, partial [Mycena filopes]